MFALAASAIVFVCTIGAALFGMFLRTRLPPHHLSEQSWELVKVVLTVLGTLTALVLGLLIASAKGSLENKINELVRMSAWIVQLDRTLAEYGPETREAREMLKQDVATRIRELWGRRAGLTASQVRETLSLGHGSQILQRQLLNLTPQNEAQSWFKRTALDISNNIAELRWRALFATGRSIQLPFLVILTLWLAAIFASFGIFAPRNGNVIATMTICALSAASAIFLIIEMDQPFGGFVRVPIGPLETALQELGHDDVPAPGAAPASVPKSQPPHR
jgi:hypothetical protein